MSAREFEAHILTRCVRAASDEHDLALDKMEANIFRLAAKIIRQEFKDESMRLMSASDQYFSSHSDEVLNSIDIIKMGWISNIPRLHDMLIRKIKAYKQNEESNVSNSDRSSFGDERAFSTA